MSKRFTDWVSLSPWSIISFSLHSLKSLFSNGYALIPVVYTGWQKGFSSPWVILVAIGVVLAILSFGIIQWSQYRYRLSQGKLGINQGLFFKHAHEIPLNKIQNVRLEQPFYFRPLNLYSLVVETAGSKKDEAILSAVNYRQALQLKKQLMLQKNDANIASNSEFKQDAVNPSAFESSATNTSSTKTATSKTLVVSKSLKDLVLFGLYQNNLFWLSVVSGSILGQVDWDDIESNALIQLLVQWYQQDIASSDLNKLLFAVIAITLLVLLLSLLSVTSAILKYHPYQLSLHQHTLHRTGGIIAKQQDALALSRVQLLRFNQPIIGRLLGLWTANFLQVKGNEVESMTKRYMLIPSMTQTQIASTLTQLTGLSSQAKQLPEQYQRINIGWFWRRAFLPLLVPVPATFILGVNPVSELMWLAALLVMAGIYLTYRQWGYHVQGNDLWIHTGVLGQSWHLFALNKVQHVIICQTASQKRKQLATLHIGLASGEQKLPYIPVEVARTIAESALNLTKHDHSNWI
ncbi:PH domain-containing protein [Shewanella sp. Isolate11]|uniref:PH domain-containing protein n=1 Tax=Shewanella sp. Isolate11 TaxID=2908530 RepID=UPI001EFD5DC3|nr:PH domain-containing protein [Shewanella sp. Isolate11]MCG9695756.1 PH domain-containing protein [Shewanella sp. Isolate11]